MTIGDTLRMLGWTSADDPRPDAELVGRFVQHRDELAFAELLRRHGPTVYGVCRRIVGHTHDADDAFQAVFLVLARKADAIRPPGMVGNWLYGVAVRTANKARVMNAKRIKRAATAREREGEHPLPGGRGSCDDADTLDLIDAELTALPHVYRAAFVACDLNGRSRSQAAKELGWPEGTVAARLAKARDLLAKRLTKRGVTLGAATFTTLGVPSALAAETLGAVRELVAVGAASAVAPAAQQLSDQVVNAMSGTIWKPTAVLTLLVGLTIGTAALVSAGGEKPGPRPERKAMTNAPVPKEAQTVWTKQPSIELEGGGRITSVAYAPSGKLFAVCRDSGWIDFYEAATRKHRTSMQLGGDPKSNPNTAVGTITAIAFRPTPHAKMGEIFAVTHKHGVKIGATDLGLMADNGAKVDDIPPNWFAKDFDPHQVTWISDRTVAMTNGEKGEWRLSWDKGESMSGRWDCPSGRRGQPTLLASIPGTSRYLSVDRVDAAKEIGIGSADPLAAEHSRLKGHVARPTCAAVSKDGKRIVTGDEGGTLIVWDGETFKEKARIEQGPGLATLALGPDGKTLAVLRTQAVNLFGWTANRTGTAFELFVFNPTDAPAKPTPIWKSEKVWPGQFTGPASLTFSPDGKTLLAAFGDPFPEQTNQKERGAVPKSSGVHVWTRR